MSVGRHELELGRYCQCADIVRSCRPLCARHDYDFLRDRHVLFGGTRNDPTLTDIWEFDGTDWQQRTVSDPTSRTGATFAYVLGLQNTYLLGGYGGPQLSDTWEYQTPDLP